MNSSELFDFLPFIVDDERAFIYTMPLILRVTVVLFLVIGGIWGSAMKFVLFYFLMQEKLSERPINILIFIDQFVDYIGNIVIIIKGTIKVISFLLFDNNNFITGTFTVLSIICRCSPEFHASKKQEVSCVL